MEDRDLMLRRYEDNLNVCGSGIIVFGVWDAIKIIIQIFMNENGIKAYIFNDISKYAKGDSATYSLIVILIVLAIVILIILPIFLLHIYTGLNASRAARRLPYKKGYLVVAIIMFIISVVGMIVYIIGIKNMQNVEINIASIIVDLTYIYILGSVIVYTQKIKSFREV